MCVDDPHGSSSLGTLVEQETCTVTGSEQSWIITSKGGGYYQVQNEQSGLCLDDTSGSSSDGNLMQMYTCLGNINQIWLITAAGNGYYSLQNQKSTLCLDDTNGSLSSGTDLQQYACLGNANQSWYFALPASTLQPFGADAELLETSICNHTVGCPAIDLAKAAGVQWIRMFAVWNYIESSSGVFNWSNQAELPWQIWYAEQKGIQVYLTATWAPQWANGATSTVPPWTGSCGNCGFAVTNPGYTYNFFYALVSQFNGGNLSGCSVDNASTCHPLVQYFGVWNEPNNLNNYNDTNYDPNNLGNYLNDFVSLYLDPAYTATKAANPSAFVVAADLESAAAGQSCGGFSTSCKWDKSWMAPLAAYYSNLYDVISFHSGVSPTTAANQFGEIYSSYNPTQKPVWMTEYGSPTPSDVPNLYEIENEDGPTWAKSFWYLGTTTVCPGNNLLCSPNNGATQEPNTAFYNAYQSIPK